MNRAILLFSGVMFLWLVGSLAAPLAAFTVNPDGTVTDPATGLMWDRCSWGQTGVTCSDGAASTHNWSGALAVAVTANDANHRGYSDWRLPNFTELESLVNLSTSNPAIDATAFPTTPNAGFWSSTVSTPNPAGARVVSFDNGSTTDFNQANDVRVRLVRSGQSFDALAPPCEQTLLDDLGILLPGGLDCLYEQILDNKAQGIANFCTNTAPLFQDLSPSVNLVLEAFC